MRLERRNARELAVQVMFQNEVGRLPIEEALQTTAEQMPSGSDEWGSVDAAEWRYIQEVVRGIQEHREEFDAIIARLAEGWTLERIANVDRIVLRLALYELLYRDVPAAVSINEAVEVAKKYSTEDSGRFVNGILGAFLRERRAGASHPEAGAATEE